MHYHTLGCNKEEPPRLTSTSQPQQFQSLSHCGILCVAEQRQPLHVSEYYGCVMANSLQYMDNE